MRPISLHLRGQCDPLSLSPEAAGRAAGASFLTHSLGIAAFTVSSGCFPPGEYGIRLGR